MPRTFDGFEHRHIWLALAVLLNALPMEDGAAFGVYRRVAEKLLHQAGLADPGLAGDECELPRTAACFRE